MEKEGAVSRCSACGFTTPVAQDRASGRVLCDDCLRDNLVEIRNVISAMVAELEARRKALDTVELARRLSEVHPAGKGSDGARFVHSGFLKWLHRVIRMRGA